MIKKGFTYVELLIVITLMAVLATATFTFYGRARTQARNTQRKNDLRQYQIALEAYSQNNNFTYPVATNPYRASTTLCSLLTKYLEHCPEDPLYGTEVAYTYVYQSSSRQWVLWGKLEGTENAWVYCSSGKSAEKDPDTFDPQNGQCPL